MDTQMLLNRKYSQLCQQLGDATYRLGLLQSQIESLKQEIKTLDALVPELKAMTKALSSTIPLNLEKKHESTTNKED